MKKIKNDKLSLIYFSPTGTTRKVLKEIADGMNFKKNIQIDLIKKDNIKKQNFTDNEIVIIGVPVYSGRIPLTVINRLDNFRANNTKTILVVVYGNRHYDDALLELKDLVIELGFLPIAATSFVGVHSFSNSKYPIAEGRPNAEDLNIAKDFGKQIRTKLEENNKIQVPGNYPYKKRLKKLRVKPIIDMDLCDFCGLCEKVCPVDAISVFKDSVDIDENICIYCHACVKMCPQKAMIFDDIRIIESTIKLHGTCQQLQIPEIFL